MITCPASYKVFNTLKDYADHRCAKPPSYVGKGKYRLFNSFQIGNYMLSKVNNYIILIHALLYR